MKRCPSVVAFLTLVQQVRTVPGSQHVTPWFPEIGPSLLLRVQLTIPESVQPHFAQYVQRSRLTDCLRPRTCPSHGHCFPLKITRWPAAQMRLTDINGRCASVTWCLVLFSKKPIAEPCWPCVPHEAPRSVRLSCCPQQLALVDKAVLANW